MLAGRQDWGDAPVDWTPTYASGRMTGDGEDFTLTPHGKECMERAVHLLKTPASKTRKHGYSQILKLIRPAYVLRVGVGTKKTKSKKQMRADLLDFMNHMSNDLRAAIGGYVWLNDADRLEAELESRGFSSCASENSDNEDQGDMQVVVPGETGSATQRGLAALAEAAKRASPPTAASSPGTASHNGAKKKPDKKKPAQEKPAKKKRAANITNDEKVRLLHVYLDPNVRTEVLKKKNALSKGQLDNRKNCADAWADDGEICKMFNANLEDEYEHPGPDEPLIKDYDPNKAPVEKRGGAWLKAALGKIRAQFNEAWKRAFPSGLGSK